MKSKLFYLLIALSVIACGCQTEEESMLNNEGETMSLVERTIKEVIIGHTYTHPSFETSIHIPFKYGDYRDNNLHNVYFYTITFVSEKEVLLKNSSISISAKCDFSLYPKIGIYIPSKEISLNGEMCTLDSKEIIGEFRNAFSIDFGYYLRYYDNNADAYAYRWMESIYTME